MSRTSVFVLLAILAAGALWWYKPWEPRRYDDTKAGKDARAIDDHVDFFREWRPPNTWEARDYIGTAEPVKGPPRMFGGPWETMKKLVDGLYAAGCGEVAYCDIKRSVKFGDSVGGLYAVLPDAPAARKAAFEAAAPFYKDRGQQSPPDVRQKYLYFGFDDWTPDTPPPSFLPE